MPQYLSPLGGVDTRMPEVRAVDTSGSKDYIGKAISDAVTGAVVFGKASAQEAGQKAAAGISGIEIPIEQVKTESASIQEQINKNLGVEQDKLGGPLSKSQIENVRDQSLRESKVTLAHLETLYKQGAISRTEASTRARLAYAQAMNEGSNYLFANEFKNAFSSVTGGAEGASVEALFPKSREDIEAEAKAKAEIEAHSNINKKVEEIYTTFQGKKSYDQIYAELQQNYENSRKADEYTKLKDLTASQAAHSVELHQKNSTQGLELNLQKMLGPKGLLSVDAIKVLNNQLYQNINTMNEQLSKVSNLEPNVRNQIESNINNYKEGMIARFKILSESDYNSTVSKQMDDVLNIWGVAVAPDIAILNSISPELVSLFSKGYNKDMLLKNVLGEKTAGDLNTASNYVKNITGAFTGGVVTNWNAPASLMSTPEGRDAIEKNPEFQNRLKTMYKNAPQASAKSMGTQSYVDNAVGRAGLPSNPSLRFQTIDYYNIVQKDIANTSDILGLPPIKVRSKITEDTNALVLVGKKGITDKVPKIFFDIPKTLIDERPSIGLEIQDSFTTFSKHRYLWEDTYDNPYDAFNDYMDGTYKLNRTDYDSKGMRIVPEDTTGTKKTPSKPMENFVRG